MLKSTFVGLFYYLDLLYHPSYSPSTLQLKLIHPVLFSIFQLPEVLYEDFIDFGAFLDLRNHYLVELSGLLELLLVASSLIIAGLIFI